MGLWWCGGAFRTTKPSTSGVAGRCFRALKGCMSTIGPVTISVGHRVLTSAMLSGAGKRMMIREAVWRGSSGRRDTMLRHLLRGLIPSDDPQICFCKAQADLQVAGYGLRVQDAGRWFGPQPATCNL